MLIAHTDEEIINCFDVLAELRPHLTRDTFISTVRSMQHQGYVLAYLAEADKVIAVAGFRVYFELSVGGNTLYVYDLVVTEQVRSQGYGGQLVAALEHYAKAAGCQCVHLDSNTNRHGAHKFYLGNGFKINAFHFLKSLG